MLDLINGPQIYQAFIKKKKYFSLISFKTVEYYADFCYVYSSGKTFLT